MEIDINKAYTCHLTQITKVPKFTEFDEWKLYKYEKDDFNNLNPLTLYYVQWLGSAKLFFNKPYEIKYGMYLKHVLMNAKLLHTKSLLSLWSWF